MGLHWSKNRKENANSRDIEMGKVETVEEGSLREVGEGGEEGVNKLGVVVEEYVNQEDVDKKTSPLVLDDTPWKNIHGGPKKMIMEHLRNSVEFPDWTKPVKGILLFGPPGK